MEQERSELHSDVVGSSLDANKTFLFSCPYLGTLEDIDTSLSFPAGANHCFRAKSPSTVDLPHQGAYCLTDKHPSCHVFMQAAATSASAGQTKKIKEPEKRKRRVSIFALPLVLILIFLAAIIWWPAPGTSLQEAIAFGSQLQGSIGNNANANDDRIIDEEPAQITAAVPAENTSESEALEGNIQSSPSLTQESEIEELAQPAAVEQEALTANVSEPAIEQSSSDEVEPLLEEVSEATAQESTPSDATEASDTAAAVVVEEDPAEGQENVVSEIDIVEEAKETAASAEIVEIEESAAAIETDIEEAEEKAALVIFDLPVIADQLSAQNIASEQPAATSPDGERIALIGPDGSTPLALRDTSNNARALFVRQSPNSESDLLTILNRRQQVAILGRDGSSTWFNVRLETGIEGWVNAVESQAGIDPSSLPLVGDPTTDAAAPIPISTITAFPVIRSAVVDTGALNVRSGPGVGYEAVTTIYSGEPVGLLGRRGLGVWVRVRLSNGLEGWVNSSLLAPLS